MNDPLFGNKIAFAILSAILLIVGLPLMTESLFGGHGGGHHGEEHHSEDYADVFPQTPIAINLGASGAAEVAPTIDLATLLAEADPVKGERSALVCSSCHTFTKGGAHLAGPNLWDVIGRPVATAEGFSYSGALKGAGGDWTYERVSEFLKNSQAYIPGSVMQQKIRKDDKRADILAYLSTLSDNPVPFPTPAPPVEEEEAAPVEDATE